MPRVNPLRINALVAAPDDTPGPFGIGRQRNDVRQLVRSQALCALDLRDHLVAPALDAEAVHVVAAEHRDAGGNCDLLAATRPTAVNLFWGAERVRRVAHDNADMPLPELKALVVQEARNMEAEDEQRNRAIGRFGAELIPQDAKLLTHCNAGSLATAYFGTALGVIFTAAEQGKVAHVWVDETRPVNQGGRLTAWELKLAEIPSALIADNMAASVMKNGWGDAVIVGADRICANGDTANKIGTYGLAVLAKEHGIPFYVAAPTSTVDLTMGSGEQIVIEERDPRELTGFTVSNLALPGWEQRARPASRPRW